MNSQFNAIDYSQQLAAAGVPQAQADVHARVLSHALAECAATKADLAALGGKLTARIDVFEARVIARIEQFEAKVERELSGMRIEMSEMRIEMSEMRVEFADMRVQLANMDTRISVMGAEIRYNRRMINLVLALQVALIVKMFFP
jgi:hypothetical protein